MRETSVEFWQNYNNKNLCPYFISSFTIKREGKEQIVFDEEMLSKYICIDNNILTQSPGEGSFPYGKLVFDTFQVELWNGDCRWTYVSLKNAKILISVSCEDDKGELKTIGLGEFIVVNVEDSDGYQNLQLSRLLVTRERPLWKDVAWTNTFGYSVDEIIEKTCTYLQIEISQKTETLSKLQDLSDDMAIHSIYPPDFDSRFGENPKTSVELLNVCAATLGICLKIGIDNSLSMQSVNEVQRKIFMYDGGVLDDCGEVQYLSGDGIDGGGLREENGDSIDSLLFRDFASIHLVKKDSIINLSYGEQSSINKLSKRVQYQQYMAKDPENPDASETTIEVGNVVGEGDDVVSADNTFDPALTILSIYAQREFLSKLKDEIEFNFTPYECDIPSNVAFEVGDLIIIQDANGHAFFSFVGSVSTNLSGYTTIKAEKPDKL